VSVYAIDKLIAEARRLASDYHKATGKPLAGVSAEIAEYDAARLLGLEICTPKVAGYDAVGRGAREGKRIQIKGRTIFDEQKKGQRIGQIKAEQTWDSVVLVLMDEHHEPYEIYEASREELAQELEKDQRSSRSKRGAMSVAKFKHLGRLVWTREEGPIEEEIWDNQANA
jgi:hypothetical protein